MTTGEFTNKIRKLKSKTKRSKTIPAKKIKIVLIIIIFIIIILVGYNIYVTSKSQEMLKLESEKQTAIETLDKVFAKYPGDPEKIAFITRIQQAESTEEIHKVMNDARVYLQLKNYKDITIQQIKSMYGNFYSQSLKAQELVRKIMGANSIEEVDKIFKSVNIEEDIRNIIDNQIDRVLASGDEYYYVEINGKSKFMSKEEIEKYRNMWTLSELKTLSITPVSQLSTVAIKISAKQCGKLPHRNDIISIYSKDGSFVTYGIIDSSYVILSSISYSETKSVSTNLNEYGDSYSSSSSSSISYNLNNLPGVLHATVIGRLDYKTIKEKFGKYGDKLNKIEDDTQIFDENVDYLLIISIPSDKIPDIIQIDPKDMVFVVKSKRSKEQD
ncbi:DUF515 domain-containing protein [Methanotorris formicicus]|uniref:Protein G-related albumin-binding (GA) module domain-containing protein n=1 Tax=Methanotorris formicicus Mc-S-70 TaxID=647171 RepID=H1KYY4_9EURY|nr:DUF515 domain-containing protein [Methanotorris formicicus]EHP86564.1 protein of unknown function DUF515 [Methanotorris formicicus Mc-S-70]